MRYSIDPLQDSLKCIAWSGRALIIGFAGGEIEKVSDRTTKVFASTDTLSQIPMNLALLKNVSLIGVHWGSYISLLFHYFCISFCN